MIGTTLGHYQITSQLGKGGMGEVYQAKDQVLGREVAIKVLPEELLGDADRVARFQREDKVLASLNHPNIASIYGLEESGTTRFLVMELVEGETLADRIKRGPIPVEESLKLALQIAEALKAAHEKGIIHRDLKPANIKVPPDGKVKVMDFGLAKAFAAERVGMNLSNSPTLSNAATQQGVILGTAAYMSPGQARGKPVDKRAAATLGSVLSGREFGGVTYDHPPLQFPSEILIMLDAEGKRVSLRAVPVQMTPSAASPQTPDWAVLFAESGLDPLDVLEMAGRVRLSGITSAAGRTGFSRCHPPFLVPSGRRTFWFSIRQAAPIRAT
jgi:serine/threonine protein kinase